MMIVGFFLAALIFLTVLLNVLLILVPFGNPAMGLLVVFVAAGASAANWFAGEKAVPAKRRQWVKAVICAGFWLTFRQAAKKQAAS